MIPGTSNTKRRKCASMNVPSPVLKKISSAEPKATGDTTMGISKRVSTMFFPQNSALDRA
jgi:hypothetical protein